jgi:uncharacterized YigZ family protein
MGAPAIFEKQIEIKLLHPASTEGVTDSGEKHCYLHACRPSAGLICDSIISFCHCCPMPLTLHEPVFYELEIKKSRFLAWVEPVTDSAQAKQRIAELKGRYADARHVCYAFYVQGHSGMSDDGEPSGTAGKPIFNVLNHKKLVNVLAVVVRYFGGVKLGAGGLTRAYGGAISAALEQAQFVEIEQQQQLTLVFPFSLESQIRRVCTQFSVTLENVQYSQAVAASIEVGESACSALRDALCAIDPGNTELIVRKIE